MNLYKLMEEKLFINRVDELTLLKRSLDEKGAELIILYGRRRIGKSRLLLELRKHRKIDVFVVMEESDYKTNLKKLSDAFAKSFQYPSFAPSSFKEAFEHLPKNAVVVIDEFSYLYNASGEFQAIWEEIAKEKELKIILSGSLIRIMEDLAFSLGSPLYGRATKVVKLSPLRVEHVIEWFSHKNIEDVLKVYFSVGGVPRYLEVLQTPSEERLKEEFLSKNGLLAKEGKLLLKESFPSSLIYPKILFSIAKGVTEASKIANETNVKASEVSKYLSVLIDYGLVEKRFPLSAGGKKDVRFYMADRFFSFWSLFVWPFYNDIDAGFTLGVVTNFEKRFSLYCSKEFEKLILEIISTHCKKLFFSPSMIGRQWGKVMNSESHDTYEIDAVALNEETKEILFVECKWKKNVDAHALFEDLKEKAKNVQWNINDRKETYALFAKSFKRKEKNCYDFKDIQKIIL